MSAKKTHWLRTTIIVLLACGIAGLALTAALYFGNPAPTSATAVIEFTFDGAADGIAPNNTAFDISGIASEEVLSEALRETGLEGTYTVEQLQQSLTALGVYPENMASQVTNYESLLNFTANRELTVGDFHPTTFNISLYNSFDKSISRDRLEALLRAVMTAYQGYFARTYSNGLDTGNLFFNVDEYDYPQQLDIINGHFQTMVRYADELYDKDPVFRLEGVGFNDISVRLNKLINSDISRLNADLTMNALTRDTARLLIQYQFEIRNLGNQLDKKSQELDKLVTLIDSYDKNEIIYLSTADSLTKIDGNSSETYDLLVETRKEVSDEITEINSRIATYQLKLSDLLKESDNASTSVAAHNGGQETTTDDVVEMTEEEIAEAAQEAERLARAQTIALEKNIEALAEKGGVVLDDFRQMLDAYNAEQINELTVSVTRYDYDTPSVFSGAFVKKAIEVAGPICALGFMLCMALIIASRKRQEAR